MREKAKELHVISEEALNVIPKSLDLLAVLISCCSCNKFSCLKQFKLVMLQFWRSEV